VLEDVRRKGWLGLSRLRGQLLQLRGFELGLADQTVAVLQSYLEHLLELLSLLLLSFECLVERILVDACRGLFEVTLAVLGVSLDNELIDALALLHCDRVGLVLEHLSLSLSLSNG